MNPDYLLKLYHYENWANQLVLSCMIEYSVTDEKMIFWMDHIINAQEIWFERINPVGKTPSLDVSRPLSAIQQALDNMHQELTAYISGLTQEDLDSEISYHNTKGIAFENILLDILVHLFNHSTHHRSQIVARMREKGIVPPMTDYIFYLRE